MRVGSTIQSRAASCSCFMPRTSVWIASSKSAAEGRRGSRSTAMPAKCCGGKRSGLEKSRSSVTSARPSAAQIRMSCSSVEDCIRCTTTVDTSWPAADRMVLPREPRFSSSLSFTRATRWAVRPNVRAPFRRHRQCTPGCLPRSVPDTSREYLQRMSQTPEDPGSAKPRCDVPGYRACRRNAPDQSKCAPAIVRESSFSWRHYNVTRCLSRCESSGALP